MRPFASEREVLTCGRVFRAHGNSNHKCGGEESKWSWKMTGTEREGGSPSWKRVLYIFFNVESASKLLAVKGRSQLTLERAHTFEFMRKDICGAWKGNTFKVGKEICFGMFSRLEIVTCPRFALGPFYTLFKSLNFPHHINLCELMDWHLHCLRKRNYFLTT